MAKLVTRGKGFFSNSQSTRSQKSAAVAATTAAKKSKPAQRHAVKSNNSNGNSDDKSLAKKLSRQSRRSLGNKKINKGSEDLEESEEEDMVQMFNDYEDSGSEYKAESDSDLESGSESEAEPGAGSEVENEPEADAQESEQEQEPEPEPEPAVTSRNSRAGRKPRQSNDTLEKEFIQMRRRINSQLKREEASLCLSESVISFTSSSTKSDHHKPYFPTLLQVFSTHGIEQFNTTEKDAFLLQNVQLSGSDIIAAVLGLVDKYRHDSQQKTINVFYEPSPLDQYHSVLARFPNRHVCLVHPDFVLDPQKFIKMQTYENGPKAATEKFFIIPFLLKAQSATEFDHWVLLVAIWRPFDSPPQFFYIDPLDRELQETTVGEFLAKPRISKHKRSITRIVLFFLKGQFDNDAAKLEKWTIKSFQRCHQNDNYSGGYLLALTAFEFITKPYDQLMEYATSQHDSSLSISDARIAIMRYYSQLQYKFKLANQNIVLPRSIFKEMQRVYEIFSVIQVFKDLAKYSKAGDLTKFFNHIDYKQFVVPASQRLSDSDLNKLWTHVDSRVQYPKGIMEMMFENRNSLTKEQYCDWLDNLLIELPDIYPDFSILKGSRGMSREAFNGIFVKDGEQLSLAEVLKSHIEVVRRANGINRYMFDRYRHIGDGGFGLKETRSYVHNAMRLFLLDKAESDKPRRGRQNNIINILDNSNIINHLDSFEVDESEEKAGSKSEKEPVREVIYSGNLGFAINYALNGFIFKNKINTVRNSHTLNAILSIGYYGSSTALWEFILGHLRYTTDKFRKGSDDEVIIINVATTFEEESSVVVNGEEGIQTQDVVEDEVSDKESRKRVLSEGSEQEEIKRQKRQKRQNVEESGGEKSSSEDEIFVVESESESESEGEKNGSNKKKKGKSTVELDSSVSRRHQLQDRAINTEEEEEEDEEDEKDEEEDEEERSSQGRRALLVENEKSKQPGKAGSKSRWTFTNNSNSNTTTNMQVTGEEGTPVKSGTNGNSNNTPKVYTPSKSSRRSHLRRKNAVKGHKKKGFGKYR